MIDKQDYEAFIWIRDNVSDDYEKAVLDPWKATAFCAITGKRIFTKIFEYPQPSDIEAHEFLENGGIDTAFLLRNGISIVYIRDGSNNPDLLEVRRFVYLVRGAEEW